MPPKNWCSIHARWSKSSLKHSIPFCGTFPSLEQNFVAYRSSKVPSRPDCIFEIPQLWQSGFSRVYSNCCCSCSFELEIIKIGQSSHKIYSNNILNFQEPATILNACTKKVWNLMENTTYMRVFMLRQACMCLYHVQFLFLNIYIYIYIHIYIYIYIYLPISLHKKDVTQSQFLMGV